MPRFRFPSLLLLLLVFVVPATVLAEEERPARMIDLLKPGMKVGVQFLQKSDNVTLWVFSDEEYVIAKDAQKMGRDELREKHELVEQRYQVALKSFLEIMDGESMRGKSVEEPFKFFAGRPIHMSESGFRGICGIVEAVGEDYILVAPNDNNIGPRAFAIHSISQLRLHDQAQSFLIRDARYDRW